jgi:ABC-type Fe3+-hydroxamate transport system substrate-binding protein
VKRRSLVLGAVLFVLGGAACSKAQGEDVGKQPERVVSLSPAITDTVVALHGESALVLVSDYCRSVERPHAGTVFSPNYERIAGMRPTLILASQVDGAPEEALRRVGPLVALPWTTLGEVVDSTRKLGRLLHHEPEANALAARLEQDLGPEAPTDAPRVLVLMGPASEDRAGYYYIKHDSLHGRLLSASGYRNAMGNGPTAGQPHLSVEQLLRVDPDAILVLQEAPVVFTKLSPLRAVQARRTTALARVGSLSMGPDVLEVRPLLQAALDGLFRESPL